jgi:hypothetical protein
MRRRNAGDGRNNLQLTHKVSEAMSDNEQTKPKPGFVEIPEPNGKSQVRADRVLTGRPIPPIRQVRLFSADEWEEFVQEWAQSLKKSYRMVQRCSGAGDMGRDVVAHVGDPAAGGEWDNYQCKHYDHPLYPGDIWVELGKLMYYTLRGDYSLPRQYYFVCPQDVGTTLARLLEKPEDLRAQLIENWPKHCEAGICTEKVPLDDAMRENIDTYPFQSIGFMPVLKMLEQHATTRWHVYRFGGGLPDRPEVPEPPEAPAALELPYIGQLFRAYSENQKAMLVTQADLARLPALESHFRLTRKSFYSAEALREFSRDHLPENEFGVLQEEIHDGIQEAYLGRHADGFERLRATTVSAINLQITDHALLPVLRPADRRGICHQLVNDERLTWVGRDGKDNSD